LISLDGDRLASMAGAEVLARGDEEGPTRAVIDSREMREGDLFVGLQGERADGGEFGAAALRDRAWGILVGTQWGRELAAQRRAGAALDGAGWILGSADPLASLQSLARAWRGELDALVIGITGSTGKTSVKDICRTLLPAQVQASPENYNTEIGMPLAVLAAPEGTEVLVLEMGMRGPGQIAELCAIAAPDVGVITNVGPVHVELLGSVEAIAGLLRDRGHRVESLVRDSDSLATPAGRLRAGAALVALGGVEPFPARPAQPRPRPRGTP